MNNLPELSYDQAKSIINRNTALRMPYTAKFAPDTLAQTYAAELATILVLCRYPNISDAIFRKGIEDIINPYGLTPEPEAGITLPPGSVQDVPKVMDPGEGWRLIEDGDPLLPGDGFMDPRIGVWIAYECRPDIFRGAGTKGSSYHVPKNDTAHTYPWRRKIMRDHPANDAHNVAAAVIDAKSVDRFEQLKETPGC